VHRVEKRLTQRHQGGLAADAVVHVRLLEVAGKIGPVHAWPVPVRGRHASDLLSVSCPVTVIHRFLLALRNCSKIVC
jgi:hypothetical protein